jgi:putative transposase
MEKPMVLVSKEVAAFYRCLRVMLLPCAEMRPLQLISPDWYRSVADSLEEAGDRLFTITRFDSSQWRSIRTTNAIERLHEEFKRRIKTQTVLPSAETAAMLFWALLASGQITMRKVDGWKTHADAPSDQPIDLAA